MVKKKDAVKIPTQEEIAKYTAIEQENILLKKQLAEQQVANLEQDKAFGSVALEMQKIRKKGKSSANVITVTEKHDHKNISLWKKDGKRIGPMHPDNAIRQLNKFANRGIMLSSDRPSEAQIAVYKQTDEYKKKAEWEQKRRANKDKSRKTGRMEKLTEEIAKMSKVTSDSLNKVLPMSEVAKR